jgi:hypothetical protein
MLNSENGGVILLGCERVGTLIVPKGMRITEKEKDSFEQKIKGLLEKIFPKVEINREVMVDFVPVVQFIREMKKEAVKGYYVGRIVVQARDVGHLYFLQSSVSPVLEIREDGHPSLVLMQDHYR